MQTIVNHKHFNTAKQMCFTPSYWFIINGRQLKHQNGWRVGYKSDFEYIENGVAITEDVKGVIVRDWPLRRAVFIALFPQRNLRETK